MAMTTGLTRGYPHPTATGIPGGTPIPPYGYSHTRGYPHPMATGIPGGTPTLSHGYRPDYGIPHGYRTDEGYPQTGLGSTPFPKTPTRENIAPDCTTRAAKTEINLKHMVPKTIIHNDCIEELTCDNGILLSLNITWLADNF